MDSVASVPDRVISQQQFLRRLWYEKTPFPGLPPWLPPCLAVVGAFGGGLACALPGDCPPHLEICVPHPVKAVPLLSCSAVDGHLSCLGSET